MLENIYTGERLGVFSTPNGAHIVRKPNGREEWHRGTLDSCRAFMERLAANPEAVGWRWEIVINSDAQQLVTQARRWIRTRKAGHITDGELAISLASLLGVDARCDLGECTHDDGSHPLPTDPAAWPV
jgi:hypothetical protein